MGIFRREIYHQENVFFYGNSQWERFVLVYGRICFYSFQPFSTSVIFHTATFTVNFKRNLKLKF